MQIKSDTVTQVKADKILEEHNQISPYMMFRYSIRSELTRKYYERRLRRFFDYIQFEREAQDMEKRFNDFVKCSCKVQNLIYIELITYYEDD